MIDFIAAAAGIIVGVTAAGAAAKFIVQYVEEAI